MIYLLRFALLAIGFPLLAGARTAGSDLKPEELVRSHLEKVGTAAARDARRNLVAEGPARVKFLVGGSGEMTGTALFFSEGPKHRLTLTFNSQQYRGEDIVFDGGKFSVSYADTHAYSPFGRFLHTYNSIIKEGLLGSALSTAFPLLDPKVKGARLKYAGTETVGEESLHRLDYRPRRGGGDVAVSLYFDPSTFRHKVTDYRVRVPAPLNRSVTDTSARETYYRLTETFDDFQPIDGLDLPSRWKLRYSISGSIGVEWEWEIHLTSVKTNQQIG
jgi:hypothetical protein